MYNRAHLPISDCEVNVTMFNQNIQFISNKYKLVFLIGVFGILIGMLGGRLVSDSVWIKFFDNLHWTSGTLAAAICAWLRYKQDIGSQQHLAKIWFLLGFGGYAVGQLIWNIQVVIGYNKFPSPSDCFYLWLGPCLILGLFAEIRAYQLSKAIYKVILLDILSLSVAALTLILVLYLPEKDAVDLLSLFVLIIYPVSLSVVVSVFIIMIPSLRLSFSPNVLCFLLSSIVTAWSWMRWNLLALTGSTSDADILNVAFSIGILIASLSSSLWQLNKSKSAQWDKLCEGFLRFLPMVNVVMASIAVIFVVDNHHGLVIEHNLTIAGSLIVILLAMIRQGLLLKEREQLLATQSFLRTVLDTVPQRIFWKDKESRYLGANKIFAKDAGVTNPEELIGKDDYQLSWSAQAPLYQLDDQNVIESKKPKLNYEEPQTNAAGKTIWLRTSKVPLFDQNEKILGVLGVYDDITELKGYHDKLKLMNSMFEHTQESILITNGKKELIDVNPAFINATGYQRDEILGQNPRFLKSGHQSDEFYKIMWHCLDMNGYWSGEIWNKKKDGEIYPTFTTISAIKNVNGDVDHYVGIASDITELKKHEKQLERIAHYDALTGIPNRVLLADRMKHAIAQAKRDKKLLAVCYIDLDGFKLINDTFGHHIGDQVLITSTERITLLIRESDTVARLGGDEFVILLQGLENTEECIHCLERLLVGLAEPIVVDGLTTTVTASIGFTIYPIDDQDPDTLLRHADYAMYTAKQSGKNRHHRYDRSEDKEAAEQQTLLNEIAEGLKHQEFELYYQPKVSIADKKVVGVEALIRWNNPQKGLMLPASFLPVMENTKLEIELGDWVINQALFQSQQWLQSGYFIPISINVTGQQLLQSSFVDKLMAGFAKYPAVSNTLLQLEILETAALELNHSIAVIQTVKSKLGLTFALDDFGTGYSTLTYLKELPVSTLKIDQSFVKNMVSDIGDKAIVEGVIALAKVFGMETVAEGVETDKQFQALKVTDCQIAQGFGIARPMQEKEFIRWYLSMNHD